jgi:Tol biopolymer transport system component
VVFFEMLTGRQIFSGETISDTLAAVLRADLQWSGLPSDTAPPIRRLLRRCLERDRNARLHDIADARLEIEEALSAPAEVPAAAPAPPSKPNLLPWLVAVLAIIATAWLAFTQWRGRPAEPSYRASLLPPEKAAFTPAQTLVGGFAVSPDGRSLAFVATQEARTMLWVRPLDSLAARPLPGTENSSYPFWSPDNRFIGFFADNKLKKIEVAGGPPQVICSANQGRGGTWNRDGVIVFTGIDRTLWRVSAAGGEPVHIALDHPPEVTAHYWPSFLPDGRHFLYQARHNNRDQSAICVASADGKPGPGRHMELMKSHTNAIYANGWLLFLRDATLFAQRFDADRLKLEGEAMPIAEHVGFSASLAYGSFSVSATGTLVYGKDLRQNSRLVWATRDGNLTPVPVETGMYLAPSLSPDGTRLAIGHDSAGNPDIWLVDLIRSVPTRLTFDPAFDIYPVWSPDGKQIAFGSTRVDGTPKLFVKPANGAGTEEQVLPGSKTVQLPSDWSQDGRYVLYTESGQGGYDLSVATVAGEHKSEKILQTPFNENQPQFSPDGRWISYSSDESGRYEVYVTSFKGAPGKFQISSGGGTQSRWRGDGKELFYISSGGRMMAVPVQLMGESFERETPRQLFEARWLVGLSTNYTYDVTRDGKRFIAIQPAEGETSEPLTLIANWPAALRK